MIAEKFPKLPRRHGVENRGAHLRLFELLPHRYGTELDDVLGVGADDMEAQEDND